ncbi:MAG TPA: hypothetical protein VFR09_04525 [Alphaproteobacteria bacterium]|nr:hypothetical protein [Alphaproteobacteria bacterium]
MKSTSDSERIAAEALESLRAMMHDGDASDSARVSAARTVFEKFANSESDEARAREKEERDAAIAEAIVLMAELADCKLSGAALPAPVVETCEGEAANAEG